MNKFYAFPIFALAVALSASGQSKFDVSAGIYLGVAKEQVAVAKAKSRGAAPMKVLGPVVNPEESVPVMLTMKDAGMADIISDAGFEVVAELGRVVIARLTPSEMEAVAALPEVVQVSLGYEAKPLMKYARAGAGVDNLHSPKAADALQHAYTGEGVIVGMMDTGLDPNHVNFLDADGNQRIKNIWEIKGQNSAVTHLGTPEKIAAYETDTRGGTHATHVLGILGGSYDKKPGSGNGQVAVLTSRGTLSTVGTNANPYYGVAKGAELSVCIGTLENNNIAVAASTLNDYVLSTGKPGVMNLSLGSQRGPHDGTDAGSLALAEAGKNLLICISAGNEGSDNISLSKTFTAADKTLKTFISTGTAVDGYIDIWSSNATPLSVKLAAVNKSTGAVLYTFEVPASSGFKYIGGPGNRYTNVTNDAEFGKYFGSTGLFGYQANVNTANNRHNVYLNPGLLSNSDSDIAAALIIEGTPGTTVDMYGSVRFRANGVAGYLEGNNDNSINGMACGDNVLAVGAYVNTNNVVTLGGIDSRYSGYTPGDIAYFSSYGHTFSGRKLPDVVGPGMGMIASVSSYNVKEAMDEYVAKQLAKPGNTLTEAEIQKSFESQFSAWVTSKIQKNPNNTKEYLRNYWMVMDGTSMSSPFVAGVLALWAQASEEKGERLTIAKVKETIKATATNDEFTAAAPARWGMGKINALEGLKYILRTTGINDVAAADPSRSLIIENRGGNILDIFLAGTNGYTASLYNLQGAAVASVKADTESTTLDASAFAPGIYVLSVNASNGTVSRKIVLN